MIRIKKFKLNNPITKFFDLYYLEIFDEEPDFQIDEVLEISERLTYYKDDFREVWLDNNRNIVKEQRYKMEIFFIYLNLIR